MAANQLSLWPHGTRPCHCGLCRAAALQKLGRLFAARLSVETVEKKGSHKPRKRGPTTPNPARALHQCRAQKKR